MENKEERFFIKDKTTGYYMDLTFRPVITLHASHILENCLSSSAISEHEKDCIKIFLKKIKKLPFMDYHFSQNDAKNINDINPNKLSLSNIYRCYATIAGVEQFKKYNSFNMININNIITSSDYKSWNLDFEELVPIINNLKGICNKLSITLNDNFIFQAINFKKEIENNRYLIENIDLKNSLLESKAYAIFLPTSNLYYSKTNPPTPLFSATLFDSPQHAENQVIKRFANDPDLKDAEIVEIDLKFSRTLNNPKSITMQRALSSINKEKLDNALKDVEIAKLKNRIAELENNNTIPKQKTKII